MSKLKFGTGFAVFILFFGVAVLEAIRETNWPWIVFWIMMGLVFFLADNIRSGHKKESK